MRKTTIFLFFLYVSKIFSQSTITDIDGNIYNTVTIGSQVWLAENLRVTKYRSGTPIPNVQDPIAWYYLYNPPTGARCYYLNDSISFAAEYGVLYNHYAVADARKICPLNTHIPSGYEWQTLSSYLGGDNIAGGALKEVGFSHWNSPNMGATNSSSFTARPSGYRRTNSSYSSNFYNAGATATWWLDPGPTSAAYRSISESSITFSIIATPSYQYNYTDGHSVRCILDNVPTNTKDNIKNKFKIQNNPSEESWQISFTSPIYTQLSLILINTTGNVVWDYNNNNEQLNEVKIPCANLPSGTYFLKIKLENQIAIEKLIKP